MFHKLPSNFTIEKYGLKARLVNESDSEFILNLRTDKELSKFIHHTDEDIQKHLSWLAEYKQREKEGRDYYFIYFKDDNPVGVNRIYNIHEYYGTSGSWLCSKKYDSSTTLSTYFLLREIVFKILQLDLLIYDVRKENKKVWKFHKMLGAQIIGESEIDYYFAMNKENYYDRLNKVLLMLNIK